MRAQDTRIHARALQIVQLVADTTSRFPSGYGWLTDQLRRAAASILLNFVEGCGQTSTGNRIKHVVIARGSAREVAAGLDVAFAYRLVGDAERKAGNEACDHVAGMLSKFR